MFIINYLVNNLLFNDVPTPYSMYFQDSATPSQEGILELHDNIMFYLVVILVLVSWLLVTIITDYTGYKNYYKLLVHGMYIEIIWTILPAVVLLIIGFPSFILLYMNDEVVSPTITIKVIGMQWYWKYEYTDFLTPFKGLTIEFDSYVIPDELLEDGQLRLLDTDTTVMIPTDTHTRFIVTSGDVIHDFAVPSLGLKIDATPGRLNQVSALIQRPGVFYGMCSELCGVAHSAMPIKIEAVSLAEWLNWVYEQEEDEE